MNKSMLQLLSGFLFTFLFVPYILHAAGVTFASGNNLNMDGNKITGLDKPVANTDATTKSYVDLLVDSVADEVRTPIDQLPYPIQNSGSYYVTRNLDGSAGGITITADNVTLDLMGFTLDGGGAIEHYGIIFSGQDNVTVKNGTVRGFGRAGIYQPTGNYAKVIDVQSLANGVMGSGSTYTGIYVGYNSMILRCTAAGNGNNGIYSGRNSIIKDSVAYNNAVGGPYGHFGIFGGSGSTLSNNIAYDNKGTYGIFGSYGSTLSNNTAYNNDDRGIGADRGSTLTNNTAYSNGGWGIYLSGSSTLIGNTASWNNLSQIEEQGGIYINTGSLVSNNTATRNLRTGIYVNGKNNVLRNNHASDSLSVGSGTFTLCFNFSLSGGPDNTIIGNTAAGCEVGYAGWRPPAERFIDNIEW